MALDTSMTSGEIDVKTLTDLVIFARLEQEANDIEPWAEVINALSLEEDAALWLLKLYNTFDDMSSAGKMFARWCTPQEWYSSPDKQIIAEKANFPISMERRNLFGGKIVRHLDSYVDCLGGCSQKEWISRPETEDVFDNFIALNEHLRTVWGTGRQSAFEWAEFYAKILNAPIEPPNALLWESSGPRESLQRLYGNDHPTPEWLEEKAIECKLYLGDAGVNLSWWDFETVICDFNVMRKGRYYPGKHIAMIRDEIESLNSPRIMDAFHAVIPAKWANVPFSKDLFRLYVDTGVLYTP